MTSHPKDLSDELIEVMKNSKEICRHLHLPVQAGSDRILQAMNSGYTKAQYLALVDKIRAAMPDIALTTDIIVGFPGETPEDVEETVDDHTYVVKPGDNLWNIARRHYGNGGRSELIYYVNRERIGADENLILPGTRLYVPETGNEQDT